MYSRYDKAPICSKKIRFYWVYKALSLDEDEHEMAQGTVPPKIHRKKFNALPKECWVKKIKKRFERKWVASCKERGDQENNRQSKELRSSDSVEECLLGNPCGTIEQV